MGGEVALLTIRRCCGALPSDTPISHLDGSRLASLLQIEKVIWKIIDNRSAKSNCRRAACIGNPCCPRSVERCIRLEGGCHMKCAFLLCLFLLVGTSVNSHAAESS